MKLRYRTVVNSFSRDERAVDNDVDETFVATAPVYTGARMPAAGHTVESEAGWNAWWRANFDAQMDGVIIPAVGDALGMKSLELRTEIKELRDRVAKLERELEQARAPKPSLRALRQSTAPCIPSATSLNG